MTKPLGKATLLLVHARSHLIPKGLQPYKGNAIEKLQRGPRHHESKGSPKRSILYKISKRCQSVQEIQDPNCHEVLDVKSPRAPPRDPKSKRSMLSKLLRDLRSRVQDSKLPRCQNCQEVLDIKSPGSPPRDPSVQKLPREAYIVRSQAFPRNYISLCCKRPIVGADEPSIEKASLVPAYNQKKGPSHITKHIMKVSVTC